MDILGSRVGYIGEQGWIYWGAGLDILGSRVGYWGAGLDILGSKVGLLGSRVGYIYWGAGMDILGSRVGLLGSRVGYIGEQGWIIGEQG